MPPTEGRDDGPDDRDAPLDDALRASRSLHDAPESVVRRAMDLWRARPPGTTAHPGVPLAAERVPLPDGAGTGPAMHCRADGVEVSLHAARDRTAARWRVEGRAAGPRSVTAVELRCGPLAAAVRPDADGAFVFEDVPAGSCRLRLVCGDAEIVLPDWELGASG